MASGKSHLALDIGGSSVKWALVDRAGSDRLEVMAPVDIPKQEFTALVEVVKNILGKAESEGAPLDQIGISTTGSVDPHGTVLRAGHFKGYENISWDALFKEWTGRPVQVHVVNDGLASTWGEYSLAAKEASWPFSHVHAVVGTGVGSGAVFQGQLVRGDSGFAGYLGHIKITNEPTVRCSCGREGCVEALVATPAICAAWEATGGDGEIESLGEAAREGDGTALSVLETAGGWLGRGLACAMNVLNPSLVTVGGGLSLLSAELEGDPLMRGVRRGVEDGAHRRVVGSAEVRLGKLGNDAGLIGAAALARDEDARHETE